MEGISIFNGTFAEMQEKEAQYATDASVQGILKSPIKNGENEVTEWRLVILHN